MTAYVVRANHGRNATPSLRYWHADTGRWGDYDTATRYNPAPTVTRSIVDALGNHSHPVDVSVTQAHGVDVDGYPYTDSSVGPVRLTHCCAAATSTNGGPLYCKSCFAEVDWAYDGPARLTPDAADGSRGPVTVRLEGELDMSHAGTPTATATPAEYIPAHSGMCPIGNHLVCRDFNAMPQGMWRTNRQTWPCEGCGVIMVRTFTPAGGWSPWQRAYA